MLNLLRRASSTITTAKSFDRRTLLQMLVGCGAGAAGATITGSVWGASHAALIGESSSSGWTRVRSVLELSGEIYLRDETAVMKGARKSTSVESTSTVDYEERIAEYPGTVVGATDGLVSILKVHEAKIENRINKIAIVDALRPECHQLVRVVNQSELFTNSLEEPLTAHERDLVDGAIASAFVDELIPLKSVKIGQSWQPSNETIARLFHLDAVHSSTVRVRLANADDAKGQIEIQGKVDAAANGVSTSITMEGKGQIDSKLGIVSWLAVKFEESREIGEAEPGFKITARLRMLRAGVENPTSTQKIEDVPVDYIRSDNARYLRIQSKQGAFQFIASDKWHVMKDSQTQTMLRFVDRNQSLCQCNIVSLPDFEAGRQMTLEGFQSEVQRALGKQFGQSLEATEKLSDGGLRWLRCVSAGEANGVPLYWIHNLLSDDAGRRHTVTFTMDRSVIEAFSGNDEQIVSSFRFQPRTVLKAEPSILFEGKENASAKEKVGAAVKDSTKR